MKEGGMSIQNVRSSYKAYLFVKNVFSFVQLQMSCRVFISNVLYYSIIALRVLPIHIRLSISDSEM